MPPLQTRARNGIVLLLTAAFFIYAFVDLLDGWSVLSFLSPATIPRIAVDASAASCALRCGWSRDVLAAAAAAAVAGSGAVWLLKGRHVSLYGSPPVDSSSAPTWSATSNDVSTGCLGLFVARPMSALTWSRATSAFILINGTDALAERFPPQDYAPADSLLLQLEDGANGAIAPLTYVSCGDGPANRSGAVYSVNVQTPAALLMSMPRRGGSSAVAYTLRGRVEFRSFMWNAPCSRQPIGCGCVPLPAPGSGDPAAPPYPGVCTNWNIRQDGYAKYEPLLLPVGSITWPEGRVGGGLAPAPPLPPAHPPCADASSAVWVRGAPAAATAAGNASAAERGFGDDGGGRVLMPSSCTVTRRSAADVGTCLTSTYGSNGIILLGDSNARRTWKAISSDLGGTSWCGTRRSDPICICEDYGENYNTPLSRAGIKVDWVGLSGLTGMGSEHPFELTASLRNRSGGNPRDVIIVGVGAWDAAFDTLPVFRARIVQLARLIAAQLSTHPVVLHTMEPWCGMDTDGMRLSTAARSAAFSAAMVAAMRAELGAQLVAVWDVESISAGRGIDACLETAAVCTSRHARSEVLDVQLQVLYSQLCSLPKWP